MIMMRKNANATLYCEIDIYILFDFRNFARIFFPPTKNKTKKRKSKDEPRVGLADEC